MSRAKIFRCEGLGCGIGGPLSSQETFPTLDAETGTLSLVEPESAGARTWCAMRVRGGGQCPDCPTMRQMQGADAAGPVA